MRKIFYTLVCLISMTIPAYGDEYYDFAKITCAKEVGLFEIASTGVANIGDFMKKDFSLNMNNLKYLEKKYDLYLLWPGNTVKQKCALKDKIIRVEVKRDKARAQGQCSANPSSHISLWVDNEKILSSVKFGHRGCFPPSIEKATLLENGGDLSLSLLIDGPNALIMEHYIASWMLPKIDKPITDYYVEGVFNRNMERLEQTIKEKSTKQGGR